MSSVDLKIVLVTVITIAAYTLVANIIPQVQSDVPEDIAFGADVTSEELVDAGRSLYEGAGGCLACHTEAGGARGPNLLTGHDGEGAIGERCEDRIADLDCKDYLFRALVDPGAYVVEGYPPIMPPTDRTLTTPQVWAIVAYLESLGGEVTVTGDDLAQAEEETAQPAAAPNGEQAAAPAVATDDAEAILQDLCLMCHQMGDRGTEMGPSFDEVGARLTASEIRTKILHPDQLISEGYEPLAGVMPSNFGSQLTATQLESIVQYLSALR